MLKATDLRIGNWVNFMEDDTVFQVTEICEGGIGVKNKIEETWIELDQFSPIPLTPEILANVGFRKHEENEHYYNKEGVYFLIAVPYSFSRCYLSYEVEGRFLLIGSPFSYLHQLQNLYYSLTGEELEIKSLT